MVRSYLLIRWVVLPITSMEVEIGILLRDLVSHGTLEGTVVDQRHCRIGVVKWKVTSELLDQMTLTTISLIGSRGVDMLHVHISKPTVRT